MDQLRLKLNVRIGSNKGSGACLEYMPDGLCVGVSKRGMPYVDIHYKQEMVWATFDLEEMEKALEQIRRAIESNESGRTDGRAEEGNQVSTTDQG